MRCANTMWRCKLIVAFLLFSLTVSAQREDSLFFVQYASTIDLLLPGDTANVVVRDFAKDSASFYSHAKSTELYAAKFYTHYSKKDTQFVKGNIYKYEFDYAGRAEQVKSMTKDSVWIYSKQIDYLIGNKIRFITFNSRERENDTTRFGYDRAGNLSGVCIRNHEKEKDSVSCDMRLYNHKAQLVVLQNVRYGTIAGTYTYDYDTAGRLIRRQFLNRENGVVLCTDTIEYGFNDLEKRFYFKKHSIRIAGFDQWISIDEILIDRFYKRTVRYELHHGRFSSKYNILAPGSVEFTYDLNGKLKSKRTVSKEIASVSEYNFSATADTIRTYRVYESQNAQQRILWSEKITEYNSEGLLIRQRTWSYAVEQRKKKWRNRLTDLDELVYQWR